MLWPLHVVVGGAGGDGGGGGGWRWRDLYIVGIFATLNRGDVSASCHTSCSSSYTEKTTIKQTNSWSADIKSTIFTLVNVGGGYGEQYTTTNSIQSQKTTAITETVSYTAEGTVPPGANTVFVIKEYGVRTGRLIAAPLFESKCCGDEASLHQCRRDRSRAFRTTGLKSSRLRMVPLRRFPSRPVPASLTALWASVRRRHLPTHF